jgi:general L-amino acid transport system permease protein
VTTAERIGPAMRLWQTRRLRPALGRLAVLGVLAVLVYLASLHVTSVLNRQNIATGFAFLSRPARFQIGESLIPFSATDSYGRALFVALLNTLEVGFIGCILATILGVLAGTARLSINPLLRRLSGVYIEVFRNTPVLLQLFFWYAAMQTLPPIRQSFSILGSFFLSQRGIQAPAVRFDDPNGITFIAIAATGALMLLGSRLAGRLSRCYLRWIVMAIPAAGWLMAWATGVVSIEAELPRLAGFGYQGGIAITPEFLALLVGLVVYTGAFIAEIVRGGIESIPVAQTEASESLGLSHRQTLRLVILPQALRIIVPPLVSEYLSLVKNSSLAVAIGFPDIVWAANAIINQTGQAIEGVLILAGVYLTLSVLTSLILNTLNERSRMRTSAAGVKQTRAPALVGRGEESFFRRAGSLLFRTPAQAIVSTIVIAAILWFGVVLTRWGILDAVWSGSSQSCRVPGAGACWVFVSEKLNFFLFGVYPQDQLWRPLAATTVVIAVAALSMLPRFWGRPLPAIWLGGAVCSVWLMGGGLGLAPVPTTSWNGLPVTLMLAASALAIALPLGIVFAVGRNSNSPSAQMISAGWIEIIRGLPLISILFLANTLLPLFLPGGAEIDRLLRAQVALTIFASAYLAEAIRAGLRAVPFTQIEASQSLGLPPLQTLRLVILPQALRTALPGIVNTAIGIFKDTSLVAIIGLFDLLGTVRAAGRDPAWLGFEIEGYLFAASIYFIFCFAMSRYGLWLEKRGPSLPEPQIMVDPA